MSLYRFIVAEKAHHGVSTLCRTLGVSRSGFYSWASRPPSRRRRTDQGLLELGGSDDPSDRKTQLLAGGPMTVEARAGRFRARVRRGGQSLSATFDTRTDAEAWRASTIAGIAAGALLSAPTPAAPAEVAQPVTVEDAAREFVAGMVSGSIRTRRGYHYKPSTTRGHENRLRLYVLPRLGRVPVAQLRRGDVQRVVDELAVVASPATAANVRDVLRLVLQRQVDLEVLDQNVAASVRAPTVDQAPARFLTAEEADRLQAIADANENPVAGALVALGLGTGVRLGEAQALAWGREGLDLEGRRLTVRHTRDQRGELLPPKSRRVREVPLGPELAARMMRYRLAVGRPVDGTPVLARSHRRAWERVREAARLPGLRVHDLRHTAATFWLASGLTVHAVAELLGHVDASLVLRLHGHALPSEVSTAAERLEAWRAGQRG